MTGIMVLARFLLPEPSDDQSNEVIGGISTDGELCLLDTGYDTRNIEFRDVSTYGLIYLVEELEDMIKNPETIDIV